jgi:hypothetical protein
MTYPHTAGYAPGRETSQAAAETVDAESLRAEALEIFKSGWEGTDWQLCKEMGYDYESIQPRRSELTAQGLVTDTGKRSNCSRSGKSVVVWGIDGHRNQKLGGLEAFNGGGCIDRTSQKTTAPQPKKSGIVDAHANWVPKSAQGMDSAEYWRQKADKYARALGMISVSYSLDEAKSIAKQGLK